MGDHFSTKAWLVVLAALTGVLSSLATSSFTIYLNRKAESRKNRADTRRDYLDPLRVASKDLRDGFDRVYARVISEKDIPEGQLKENYNLRFWFHRCKDYIVNPDALGTDEMRRRDIAMHSGGMGAEAASTLYYAASYLYYATRIRFKSPYIQLGSGDRELIARIDDVRTKFNQLEFYSVTQDSTGVSMRNACGELKDYREFCEAITSRSAFLASLDRLGTFLDQSLPAKA